MFCGWEPPAIANRIPAANRFAAAVDYDDFIGELDKVWRRCFDLLVVGGRLVCVVGDVCLSRRKNEGRHTVVPLHATIHCRGEVVEIFEEGGERLARLKIGAWTDKDMQTLDGEAVVAIP